MKNTVGCFRSAILLILLGFLVVGCHEDSNSNNDETRSIDGSGNNLQDPLMGATFTELLRLVFSDYADRISEIPEAGLPSARVVSNIVSSQDELIPNTLNASDYIWQ